MLTPIRALRNGQRRRLWFDFLAGPIIWIIYFLAGYGLIEFVCKLDLLRFSLGGLTLLSLIITGLTIVALLATLYAGFSAYHTWQQQRQAGAEQAQLFMSLAGVLLSGLFALTILLTGIPVFFLRPC